MRCYVDYADHAEFTKAFKRDGDLMFVKTRADLSEPDMTLGGVVDDHPDLFVVGPRRSWFARIERTISGSLRIYDGKSTKSRKRKPGLRRRR